jgi:hypothetical protein
METGGGFMLSWMADHMLHPSFFLSLGASIIVIVIITYLFYALMKAGEEHAE